MFRQMQKNHQENLRAERRMAEPEDDMPDIPEGDMPDNPEDDRPDIPEDDRPDIREDDDQNEDMPVDPVENSARSTSGMTGCALIVLRSHERAGPPTCAFLLIDS